MISALTMAAALLVDHWLGEPRRAHPLVGYGRWANWLEKHLRQPSWPPLALTLSGLLAVVIAVVPLALACSWLVSLPVVGLLLSLLLLYLCIGQRSLLDHARAVATPLLAGDLIAARQAVAMMVSRDCRQLDSAGVARAAVESVLENGNDATVGALFWFAVGGAPAAVAYRLINCLDAMWGYRNPRFRHFGWAAARLDDLVNLLPARLTVLLYALAGDTRTALRCAHHQGHLAKSPNGGPVMAAGAGALNLSVGGGASYGGHWLPQPVLGAGPTVTAADIERAGALVQRTLVLGVSGWLLLSALCMLLQE